MSNEEKTRLRLSVTQEVLDYIEGIKEEQNLGFKGDAISFLVVDHQRLKASVTQLYKGRTKTDTIRNI